MIFIAGATGWLGGLVAQKLRAQGKAVRALVRGTSEPSKVAALQKAGAELSVGDLKEPATLAAALKGVDTVISTVSSTLARQPGDSLETVDLAGQRNLVDAAKAAGVRHFVFVSFPPSPVAYPLQDFKRATEQKLATSGLGYTVVQPTYFCDVWLSPALNFDFTQREVVLYGDGGAKCSWITVEDVARAVVAAANLAKPLGGAVPVGGPEALSYPEVLRIFEEVAGAPFKASTQTTAALEQGWAAASDPMQKTFAGLMLGAARNQPVDLKKAEQSLGFRATETVRDYARRVLGKG